MPGNTSKLQKIVECLDALMTRLDQLEERRAKNDADEDADQGTEADSIYTNTSDFMTSSGQRKTAPHQPFDDNVRDEKSIPHRIHGDPAL